MVSFDVSRYLPMFHFQKQLSL